MLQDAKGYLSACTQVKNAKMRHFPFHNDRTAADVLGHGRKSYFPAFANATNAEACMVADAGFCHIEITLFKNLQRQQGSRIKHGVERENWQNGHFTCHASGAGRLINRRYGLCPNAASMPALRQSGRERVLRRNRQAPGQYAADDKNLDWPGE